MKRIKNKRDGILRKRKEFGSFEGNKSQGLITPEQLLVKLFP